jgi:hypothetical protein
MAATFVDVADIKAAIAEVRDDRKSTNWALLSYQGENTNNVALLGKGEGGVNELIDQLQDDIVGYGLVRLVERRDDSDTIKFVYVRWTGEGIHRMLRARLGTHSGAIKEIVSPYHVGVEATTKDEISEDIIWSHVRKASGTATYVIDKPGSSSASSNYAPKSPQSGSKPGGSPSFAGGVNKQSGGVNFTDEKALRAAIADVRNDGTGTNWVLASYDAPNSNNVVLLGSGEGGSAELLDNLKDDIVAYGLVRQSEKFDDSVRTMFAFINWTGENIHRMLRAKLSTHSGAIKEIFHPYHVSINAEKDSEISVDIITTTIRETMGTASKVRN